MRRSLNISGCILTFAALNLAATAALAEAPAPAPAPEAKAPFREPGRFGVLGAITEDGWKGGLIFEHEYFEAQVLAHASYSSKDTYDIRVSYKLGARMALGTLNYLAFGAEFGSHPGAREDGVSIANDYVLGPYISLQRYFAATPVMLNLWVNPVQYDHELEVVDGHAHANPTWRFFQTGGFGLGYVF
jgi:hypothetical protein